MNDARLIVAKDVDVDLRNEYLNKADGIVTAAGMSIFNAAIDRARCVVMRAKTVDAVPVVHAEFKLTGYDEAWGSWGDCQNCGHRNMVGSKYCNGCGAKLELIT